MESLWIVLICFPNYGTTLDSAYLFSLDSVNLVLICFPNYGTTLDSADLFSQLWNHFG